uniref:Putative conserved plasma membrane protein n=1 Tax=Corethrella appendiculata TaxID=1370023 RepID=U5EFK3_9DIPT
MGASTKTGKFAVGFTFASFFFIIIAFATPFWLQNDGERRDAKFNNLGLWEVCFTDFQDIHRFYDTKFTGCMWIFEEEYYIIHDFLLPGFFIAVQFFFTICFTLLLIGILITLIYLGCSKDNDRYIMLLLTNGTTLIISALCGLIAVITFGANGDNRDWMPNWEHNDMGWSFALAVIGVFLIFPAGVLFVVEARRATYRRLNEIGNQEAAYSMDDRKYRGGHTDI